MAEGIRSKVSRSAWADLIYDELEGNDRRPTRSQRGFTGRTF
jgi:hypothetical protein